MEALVQGRLSFPLGARGKKTIIGGCDVAVSGKYHAVGAGESVAEGHGEHSHCDCRDRNDGGWLPQVCLPALPAVSLGEMKAQSDQSDDVREFLLAERCDDGNGGGGRLLLPRFHPGRAGSRYPDHGHHNHLEAWRELAMLCVRLRTHRSRKVIDHEASMGPPVEAYVGCTPEPVVPHERRHQR